MIKLSKSEIFNTVSSLSDTINSISESGLSEITGGQSYKRSYPMFMISGTTKILFALLLLTLMGSVMMYLDCSGEDNNIQKIFGKREFGLSWSVYGSIFSILLLLFLRGRSNLLIYLMISSLPLLIKLGDLLKFGETCEIVNVLSGLLPLPIIGSFKIIRLILSAILKLFYKIPSVGPVLESMFTTINSIIPDIPCL